MKAATTVVAAPLLQSLLPHLPVSPAQLLCSRSLLPLTALALQIASSLSRILSKPMRAGAGPGAKSAKLRRTDQPDAGEDEDDSVDDFKSHFDFKQESSQAPKKSRKRRKASEADGKSRKISSFFAQK